MSYGEVVPKGHLPVFSCDTEEEAKLLLVSTCEKNLNHQFVARELAQEQTVENLVAFGRRLAEAEARIRSHRLSRERSLFEADGDGPYSEGM